MSKAVVFELNDRQAALLWFDVRDRINSGDLTLNSKTARVYQVILDQIEKEVTLEDHAEG